MLTFANLRIAFVSSSNQDYAQDDLWKKIWGRQKKLTALPHLVTDITPSVRPHLAPWLLSGNIHHRTSKHHNLLCSEDTVCVYG